MLFSLYFPCVLHLTFIQSNFLPINTNLEPILSSTFCFEKTYGMERERERKNMVKSNRPSKLPVNPTSFTLFPSFAFHLKIHFTRIPKISILQLMLKYSWGFIKNNFEIFRSVDLSVYIRNILQSLHNQCVFSLVIVHSILRSPFKIFVVNDRGEDENGVGLLWMLFFFCSFHFIFPSMSFCHLNYS